MKIQDLDIMEVLTIGQAMPRSMTDRIQGGLSLSSMEELTGLENISITREESLSTVLDNGIISLSAVSIVGRISGYDISYSSSNSMISVG